jgi:hypothetical protein
MFRKFVMVACVGAIGWLGLAESSDAAVRVVARPNRAVVRMNAPVYAPVYAPAYGPVVAPGYGYGYGYGYGRAVNQCPASAPSCGRDSEPCSAEWSPWLAPRPLLISACESR